MKTTTTCAGCGKEIPPAIVGNAYCVQCRYHDRDPAPSWDSGGDRPGEQIRKGWLPGAPDGGSKNGIPIQSEASVDFWDQVAAEAGISGQREELAPATDSIKIAIEEALAGLIATLTDECTPLQAGQQLFLLAFLMGKTEFKTRRELADHLKVDPSRITQIERNLPSDFNSVRRLNSRTAQVLPIGRD